MCCGENDRTAAPRQAPHRDRELSAQQTEGHPELSLCHIYLIYLLADFCEWGMVQYKRYNNVTPVPADGKMTSGWYYLNSNVTVNGRVNLTGDTNLILGDGYTLTVDGLYIPAGKTLTIYGQTGTGTINSDPSSGAAIGGVSGQDSGNITIYGGTVTAEGSKNGAAIGCGEDGTVGKIEIYGGKVTADNSDYENGAGIGGGEDSDGGTINISGGEILAEYAGDGNGAAIGGGNLPAKVAPSPSPAARSRHTPITARASAAAGPMTTTIIYPAGALTLPSPAAPLRPPPGTGLALARVAGRATSITTKTELILAPEALAQS